MEEEQNIPNWQNGDQNIESISPPNQHKRDTDTVVPEGWKLGKDASPGIEDVI